ncbi:hypothetical protein FQN49_007780, partial [Arthroderma sp. PD_2]
MNFMITKYLGIQDLTQAEDKAPASNTISMNPPYVAHCSSILRSYKDIFRRVGTVFTSRHRLLGLRTVRQCPPGRQEWPPHSAQLTNTKVNTLDIALVYPYSSWMYAGS